MFITILLPENRSHDAPDIALGLHHDLGLSAHLNLAVLDVLGELLADDGKICAVAGCRVLTVDGGHWMVDTYSPVGLGKIRVRSRAKVGFYIICFSKLHLCTKTLPDNSQASPNLLKKISWGSPTTRLGARPRWSETPSWPGPRAPVRSRRPRPSHRTSPASRSVSWAPPCVSWVS